MSDIRDILDPFRSAKETQLGRHNAAALVQWVEEHARKIGLSEAPELFCLEHEAPGAWGGLYKGKGFLYLTDGYVKKISGTPNLNLHVPDNLKATLAHEMSHLRDMTRGTDSIKLRKLPIFTLPILSVIGYEIYTRARKRHHDNPSKPLHQHIREVSEAEKHHSAKHDTRRHHAWKGPMLEWSKRLAIAGAGLLAGGTVARQMSLAAEFRADRAAVMATDNPEAYIEALAAGHKYMREFLETHTRPELDKWEKDLSTRSFWENMKQICGAIKQDIANIFLCAHPSEAQRTKAMRRFAEKQGMPLPGL